jgi:hypothetical protein
LSEQRRGAAVKTFLVGKKGDARKNQNILIKRPKRGRSKEGLLKKSGRANHLMALRPYAAKVIGV